MSKIYRIRHKKTGLFSTGGTEVSADGQKFGWTKKGKVWTGIGPLRNHLNQYVNTRASRLADWEVIEYELVETETAVKSAVDALNPNMIVKALKQ